MKEHYIISNYLQSSLTVPLYSSIFQKLGVNHCFVPVEIPAIDMNDFSEITSQRLTEFVATLRNNKDAMSVVVSNPFKQRIISICDSLDSVSSVLGTVNLILADHGYLKGYNLDGQAFFDGLVDMLHFNISGKRVLILGAGGVSTAVAFKLAEQNVGEIGIYDIDREKSDNLIKKLHAFFDKIVLVQIENMETVKPLEYDLVYNGTGVGKKSYNNESQEMSPLTELFVFKPHSIAVDANYTPWETTFLKQASLSNCVTLNGFWHMVYFTHHHIQKILPNYHLSIEEVKSIAKSLL